MNIAFLTSEYVTESNFTGGIANKIYKITYTLKRQGHNVEIFTQSDRNETISYEGIMVHRVKINNKLQAFFNSITKRKFINAIYILLLSYSLSKRFLKRHYETPFDIIHTDSYLSCGLFLSLLPRRLAPVVARIASYEPLIRNFYRKPLTCDQRIKEWLEVYTLRKSDAVYSPTKLLADMFKKRGVKVKIVPVPFFIETKELDESIYQKNLANKKYLLFYGSIGLLKGCKLIAECLPEVLAKYPEMHFVFVGRDAKTSKGISILNYIMQKTEAYKGRVHYLGTLKHPQLYPVINNSQGVVLPSYIENLPNTMIESMALGKVVIGTRGTSFEEIIEDGKTGLLIEPGNKKELVQAIERLWNMSPQERETIGNNAKKRVSILSPEHAGTELEGYFQKVIYDNQ